MQTPLQDSYMMAKWICKLFCQIRKDIMYILSSWFKQPKYKDLLDYIHNVGCEYYFDYIPLNKLGLPVSTEYDSPILPIQQ